jgi:thiamine biosynthesis protein ThiS
MDIETTTTGATILAVTLNGEGLRLAAPATVASLLEQIGLDRRKVAVERNEAIVPRGRYAETWLRDGDCLEVVHFIGGG